MEEYVFPIIAGESLLPLYLCSAGGTTSQPPVDRPAGFPVFHILYCTRGTGKLSAGGKETVIGTRQGFLLYPGVAHAYAALETPWETHWVTFDGHAAASTVRALGFDRSKVFCITDLPGLEKIWNALILRSKSGGVDRGYQCSALVYSFLIFLRSAVCDQPPVNHPDQRKFDRVLAYIDGHFPLPLSLEELSSLADVSPQYLCRLFRRYLNMRPFVYIAKRRIQEAKKLLLEADSPLSVIAEKCGYHDPSYFCAVFRRYEHMTPQEFRQLHSSLPPMNLPDL